MNLHDFKQKLDRRENQIRISQQVSEVTLSNTSLSGLRARGILSPRSPVKGVSSLSESVRPSAGTGGQTGSEPRWQKVEKLGLVGGIVGDIKSK